MELAYRSANTGPLCRVSIVSHPRKERTFKHINSIPVQTYKSVTVNYSCQYFLKKVVVCVIYRNTFLSFLRYQRDYESNKIAV